jgi:hypothetical protein
MSAMSRTWMVREHVLSSDHSGLAQVVDTYRLAVAVRFLCLHFFAAAKKVSAAPHRGEPNRPITNQGKAPP